MAEINTETLTIDFDSESRLTDKVTKAWAKDLSKQLSTAFQQITDALNKVNNNFEIFNKKFDNLENGLRREITAAANAAESALALTRDNKSTIENLQMEIISMKQDHKKEINLLKQEYSSQQMKIESVKSDNLELKSKYDAIRTQTNSMETYSRRDNLLFHGIRQPTNESDFSCAKSIRKFLVNQLQMSEEEASSVQFVRCHRLNEHNKRSEIKPIIARFKSYSDREMIWSKKSLLTNKEYAINEDFPREIAYRRRKLLPVFSKARKLPGVDKKTVTLKSDILTISGKRYSVDTLNQLKGPLDMKIFNERSNDNRVVFGGMFSNFHPLSNYYSCPITFRKQKYYSVEHAYQHRKALFFGHEESANRILATREPSEAKRLSYEVTGSRDQQRQWDDQRIDLMTSLVKAKCEQHPVVEAELTATGNKLIAESGRDRFYAIGLPITHKDILVADKWTGKSKLGEILMKVRHEIKEKV